MFDICRAKQRRNIASTPYSTFSLANACINNIACAIAELLKNKQKIHIWVYKIIIQ